MANHPEGIIAGPADEDNFFEWDVVVVGPEGTCFEYGVFPAKITFSEGGYRNFVLNQSNILGLSPKPTENEIYL